MTEDHTFHIELDDFLSGLCSLSQELVRCVVMQERQSCNVGSLFFFNEWSFSYKHSNVTCSTKRWRLKVEAWNGQKRDNSALLSLSVSSPSPPSSTQHHSQADFVTNSFCLTQARLCTNYVTLGDMQRPLAISAFLSELHAGFRLLNLKNDHLRKRFDALKYDMKKVEGVVYDLSIRGLVPKKSDSWA